MIIDSHTHFYDPARPEGVPWPSADSPLYRTVLPRDFEAVATPVGVTGTVVVEASPVLEDNQWILDLAHENDTIVGFVGNLDLRDAGFRGSIERFSKYHKFRGIRARGFSLDQLMDDTEIRNLEFLSSNGLMVDLMVKPETLDQAVQLAQRLPELKMVVDHIAHVSIDGKSPEERWMRGIEKLSNCSNVSVKLSRLTESAAEWPASTDPEYYRPTIQVLWDTFGPARLPWGSNWPVTELASDYATNLTVVAAFLEDKAEEDRNNVYWKASQQAYGWKVG